MALNIPATLQKNIIGKYGKKGQTWLKNLPRFLKKYEASWDFKTLPCFKDANMNFVAPVISRSNKNWVIKACVPNKILAYEIKALKIFNGRGCVKLIKSKPRSGIVLLENIQPGLLLENYPGSAHKKMKIAVDVLKKLHKINKNITKNQNFPTLEDWFTKGFKKLYKTFDGTTGPFPKKLTEKAVSLSQDLLTSIHKPALLHTDLHYANILYSDTRGWLAIDPHGVVGEIEFESPLPRLNKIKLTQKYLKNHFDEYCDLTGFDKQRVLGWAFSKGILAAWWTYEDHGKIGREFLEFAKLISQI